MGFLVRFQGKWMELTTKPYEAERMTTDVAWIQIKESMKPEDAYRVWFERQRKLSRLLQQ